MGRRHVDKERCSSKREYYREKGIVVSLVWLMQEADYRMMASAETQRKRQCCFREDCVIIEQRFELLKEKRYGEW